MGLAHVGLQYRIVCRRDVSISRKKNETSKISMKYLLEACERGQNFLVRGPAPGCGSPSRREHAGGALARAKVAGFERAWNAGAELVVLYGITSGGARKAKIFSGARAEAALATRFLGENLNLGGGARKHG